MKSLFPIQIKADSPESLYKQVQDEIKKGNDLYAPPFVAFTGEICQYMVTGTCLYEYQLVEAYDLDELDTKVQALSALGFDFMFSTVMWCGSYLQWMQRMNEPTPITPSALRASPPNTDFVGYLGEKDVKEEVGT